MYSLINFSFSFLGVKIRDFLYAISQYARNKLAFNCINCNQLVLLRNKTVFRMKVNLSVNYTRCAVLTGVNLLTV